MKVFVWYGDSIDCLEMSSLNHLSLTNRMMKSLAYDPAHVMSCHVTSLVHYSTGPAAYPRTWQHCTREQTARNCDVT